MFYRVLWSCVASSAMGHRTISCSPETNAMLRSSRCHCPGSCSFRRSGSLSPATHGPGNSSIVSNVAGCCAVGGTRYTSRRLDPREDHKAKALLEFQRLPYTCVEHHVPIHLRRNANL